MKTNYATLKYETILFNSCFKVGDVILTWENPQFNETTKSGGTEKTSR
jgi:hypothetical protein